MQNQKIQRGMPQSKNDFFFVNPYTKQFYKKKKKKKNYVTCLENIIPSLGH